MGGSQSKTKTTNRPLNAAERADIFNSQMGLFSSALGQYTPNASGQYAGKQQYSSGGVPEYGQTSWGSGSGWDLPARLNKSYFGKPVQEGQGLGKADPMNASVLFNAPQYDAPGYIDAEYTDAQYSQTAAPKTLSGGDYDRFEKNIVESRWAPLSRAKELDRKALNQSLADRGIYSSGLAVESENDLAERYAPQFAAAGAEAATQRYGMQANELAQLNALAAQESAQRNQFTQQGAAMRNQFMQNDAAQRNTFNMEQAQRNYASNWAPLEFLAKLYGATGGQVGATNQASMQFGYGG